MLLAMFQDPEVYEFDSFQDDISVIDVTTIL